MTNRLPKSPEDIAAFSFGSDDKRAEAFLDQYHRLEAEFLAANGLLAIVRRPHYDASRTATLFVPTGEARLNVENDTEAGKLLYRVTTLSVPGVRMMHDPWYEDWDHIQDAMRLSLVSRRARLPKAQPGQVLNSLGILKVQSDPIIVREILRQNDRAYELDLGEPTFPFSNAVGFGKAMLETARTGQYVPMGD